MGAAIGPGDFVECVSVRTERGYLGARLTVGRVYVVEAAGVTPPGDTIPNVPWVRLVGVVSDPKTWGFRAALFRPIYRPRADFIEALKQPTPARTREVV